MRARDALPALVAVSILANCSPSEGPDANPTSRAPSSTTQENPTDPSHTETNEIPTTTERPAPSIVIKRKLAYVAISTATDAESLQSQRYPAAETAAEGIETGTSGAIDLELTKEKPLVVVPTAEELKVLKTKGLPSDVRTNTEVGIIKRGIDTLKPSDADLIVVSFRDSNISKPSDPEGKIDTGKEFVYKGIPIAVELNPDKTTKPSLLAHEIGHGLKGPGDWIEGNDRNMLGHDNISHCDRLIFEPGEFKLPLKMTPTIAKECSNVAYGDHSSVMSDTKVLDNVDIYNSADLMRLGLLKGQVQKITKPGVYNYDLLELSDTTVGTKMVLAQIPKGMVVPVNTANGEHQSEFDDGTWYFGLEYSSKTDQQGKSMPDESVLRLKLIQLDGGLPVGDVYGLPLSPLHYDENGYGEIGLTEPNYQGEVFEYATKNNIIRFDMTESTPEQASVKIIYLTGAQK